MNIELLSKMVRELLLDNDTVALPGIGSFVAEMVPAVFSDKGFTINPPYRKLYFRENIEQQDDLLTDLYASSNNVSKEVAAGVLRAFLGEVKDLLNSRKNVVFPDLGRLRATKENNYFFVPFENMDIYPEGVGLEPVSLKVRMPQRVEEEVPAVEEAPVEVAPAVEQVAASEPVVAPVEEAPVVEVAPAAAASAVAAADVDWDLTDMVELADDEGTSAEVPAGESKEEVKEETPAEEEKVEVKEEDTEEIVEEVEPAEEVTETEDVEPAESTEEVKEEVNETPKKRGLSAGWKAVIWIVAVLIVLLAVFVILAHVAPDFVDKLLYSKEELEILNYPLI
ncbi:MAG: hypothetical protein LUC24_02470 [Bacteroidales bacterium]|nr:hypothetical protein [Bacteroidales bacterium]